MSSRILFLRCELLLLAAISLAHPVCCRAGTASDAAESKPAAKRPNIVFFFADDQTTSTLGCYGNEIVQTPTIDALARDGVRF
ncbi:MAG: acetylglucosamine-6-sulfatase, partial [Planctomycetota bacterium]